jgi:hypothetical protein
MKIQDNVSSPSNGVAFTVSGIRFLGVSITGTATTFQVDFYATINDIDYFPIAGRKVDDPDFNFVSSTNEDNKGVI